MKKLGFLTLIVVLFFSACRKEDDSPIVDPTPTDPTITSYEPQSRNITASFTLFVVDENETPVNDVQVSINGQSYTTDTYGHFSLNDLTLNALGTLVKVDKTDYFPGSRRFFPVEGERSRIKIQLLPKNFDQSFSGVDGGLINFGSGASVNFSPNSIQNSNGELYQGTVKIASQWLDPSTLECLEQMPGNLQGINTAIEEVALTTYGMIAIEVESESGETLNIAEGNTAEISIPVPADFLDGAPAQIPLWSYNETYGLWEEEGIANLEGNHYVGQVSHFSFWNCDVPFDYVNLKMRLVDTQTRALNNYKVILTANNNVEAPSTSGSGLTNEQGMISGAIPANEILTLRIFNSCKDLLYTDNIGPFSTNNNLGNLTISGTEINNTTITGSLFDCDINPVTNGLVLATYDGQTIYAYMDKSDFSIDFSSCSNSTEIEIVATNLDDFTQSNPIIAPAKTKTDLGSIKACDNQLEGFVSLTIDGETTIITGDIEVFIVSGTSNFTQIFARNLEFTDVANFTFNGHIAGDYTTFDDYFLIEFLSQLHSWSYLEIYPEDVIMDSFIVTEYGTKLEGSFSGSLLFYDTLSINCTFDITL